MTTTPPSPSPPPPPRGAPAIRRQLDRSLDDALGRTPRLALAAVARLKIDLAWLERRAVNLARAEGYDWGRISRLLQISRQAARQRFARVEMSEMLPTTQRQAYRDPIADERLENTAHDRWLREMRRLDGTDEAVMW